MAVTTISDQERDEGAHADRIGAIRDGRALAAAFDQTRARQDGDMGGKRVVRTADSLGETAGAKSRRFLPHQKPEYFQSGRLPERCERMRRRHGSPAKAGATWPTTVVSPSPYGLRICNQKQPNR